VTDPIESMLASAEAIVCAFAKALIVDREALLYAQESNDVMMGVPEPSSGVPNGRFAADRASPRRCRGAIDVLGAFSRQRMAQDAGAAPAKIGARHRHCVTGRA